LISNNLNIDVDEIGKKKIFNKKKLVKSASLPNLASLILWTGQSNRMQNKTKQAKLWNLISKLTKH
jgi:hypothetical protein